MIRFTIMGERGDLATRRRLLARAVATSASWETPEQTWARFQALLAAEGLSGVTFRWERTAGVPLQGWAWLTEAEITRLREEVEMASECRHRLKMLNEVLADVGRLQGAVEMFSGDDSAAAETVRDAASLLKDYRAVLQGRVDAGRPWRRDSDLVGEDV